MTKLNATQEDMLRQISEAKAQEKLAIDALEAQLKVLKSGVGYPKTHALVREAYEMGVPKRQIGMAYGTTDAYTINRIIDADVATPAQLQAKYNALVTASTPTHNPTPTPEEEEEDSVEVTPLQPADEDYPEFLRNVENPPRAAKIRVSLQNPTPFGKIGGLSAVVDLDHKIAFTDEPTPLTNLFESDREAWPEPLETALAPYFTDSKGLDNPATRR